MGLVEIAQIVYADLDDERLWGRSIDVPKPGAVMEGRILTIAGWALGRTSRVVAVEVMHAAAVIRRVAMNLPRPDVAADYPDVPGAEGSGFQVTVGLLPAAERALTVHAVLANQQRLPLASIHLQAGSTSGQRELEQGALVSIVIPCFNRARFLSAAIESVLAQTYPYIELVIVDDGSTDNTEAVVARYPGAHFVRQDNCGVSVARNTGLSHSTGSFLVFLDADDRLLPPALATGLASLRVHPDCAIAFGRWRYISADGSPQPGHELPCNGGDNYVALLRGNCIGMHAAVMYRRAVFESIGGFNPSLKGCEDYELYLRIARRHRVCFHDDVIAEYRRHGDNTTRDRKQMLRTAVTVLRSERKHVQGDAIRSEALKTGLTHYQSEMAALMKEEAQVHLRSRNWMAALRDLGTLLRYAPGHTAWLVTPLQVSWTLCTALGRYTTKHIRLTLFRG
jgi:GT2 family glycosyltransferase